MHILLASASPRRKQLMTEYGYEFTVQPADVEEITPEDLNAGDITLYNARLKAEAIADKNPEAWVLGVDTLVAFEGAVLGKPRDLDHAFEMLSRLNGRVHEVYSGVFLVRRASNVTRALVEITRVKFRTLSEPEIRAYMDRIHPLDKAGAYAAQDDGPDGFIECVEGSMTNVVGLPMEALGRMLAKVDPGH